MFLFQASLSGRVTAKDCCTQTNKGKTIVSKAINFNLSDIIKYYGSIGNFNRMCSNISALYTIFINRKQIIFTDFPERIAYIVPISLKNAIYSIKYFV